MCLAGLKSLNLSIFYQVTALLNYFTTESPNSVLESQIKYGFVIPLNPNNLSSLGTPELFLTRVFIDFPSFSKFIRTTQPEGSILKIESGKMTATQILSDIGAINTLVSPRSFIEFYDIHSVYEQNECLSEMSSIEKEFEKYFHTAWLQEKEKQIYLLNIVRNTKDDKKLPTDMKSIKDISFQKIYSNFISNIGKFLDSWQQLLLSLQITEYVSIFFENAASEVKDMLSSTYLQSDAQDRSELKMVPTIIRKELGKLKSHIQEYMIPVRTICEFLFPELKWPSSNRLQNGIRDEEKNMKERSRIKILKNEVYKSPDGDRIIQIWNSFYVLQGIFMFIIQKNTDMNI
jgi:hypothetical protein